MKLSWFLAFSIALVSIFLLQSDFQFMSSASSSDTVPPMQQTANPLRFFLLGATGRTGMPFLTQALDRGHHVTVFVRNASKLPANVSQHPRLQAFSGELENADAMAKAINSAKPDVIYAMLASDPAPHTAVSTGTHSTILALEREEAKEWNPTKKPVPFISIAGWGAGPTEEWSKQRNVFSNFFLAVAKSFWKKPMEDFIRQLKEVDEAQQRGVIKPTLIAPPLLTNGKRTTTYQSGDVALFKDTMNWYDTIGRADMADLCLKVGEQKAAGEPVPEWVAIRNP